MKLFTTKFVGNVLCDKMDKNDAELTRMAIEEILRETKQKESNDLPHSNQERKINPLGKTNKHFLGRTLNAIVRHNERTEDRNRRNCRKKLKELNSRRGSSKRTTNVYSHKRSKKHKTKKDFSESDDSCKRKEKKRSRSKRRKKQKHKKTQRRNSSSSSSSSEHTNNPAREERWPQQNYEVVDNEVRYDATNVDMQEYSENVAAWMIQPMLWTAQMQQLYQYKALIEMSQVKSNETVQIEELSLSSSSLSDVNFEEVVESKPSLKVMLTINLSTDEEEEPNKLPSPLPESLKEPIAKETPSIEVSDSDADQLEENSAIIELSDSDGDESSQLSQKTETNGPDTLIGSKENIIKSMSIESNSCIAVDLTDE